MSTKRSPEDFRVTELLTDGYIRRQGPFRVYKVTKRKLTSLEASGALAQLAGVPAAEVALAGLKDRQGITVQFMSVRGGRIANLREEGLTIEPVGFAREPLESTHSLGNSFRIRLRDLDARQQACLEEGLETVRRIGLPNYFDEQRFGNLQHGQGWIAIGLMRGQTEAALKRLLCARSERDDPRHQRGKEALDKAWGDWRACREIAGRMAVHHSVFEHLREHPVDFAGAFGRVSRRVRLIHLYAFQSHLWNRSVARLIADTAGSSGACVARSIEGDLVFPRGELVLPEELANSFPLPGERLQGVPKGKAYALLERALFDHGLRAKDLQITDIPGFRLKPEDRPLFIRPKRMRMRQPEQRGNAPAGRSAVLSFDLPRGAYATMVVKRLFARPVQGRVILDRAPRPDVGRRDPRERPHSGPDRRGPRPDERRGRGPARR